jgi:hypothetical protein
MRSMLLVHYEAFLAIKFLLSVRALVIGANELIV